MSAGKKRIGPGRPSKYSAQLTRSICKLVEQGDAAEVAAGVRGVSRSTFYEWLERKPEFRTAIARARDVFESRTRGKIMRGDGQGIGFGPAKAALEVLSRRVPARWSQRIKHELDESNRLLLETLRNVCNDPAVFDRVRETGDLSPVIISVCAELSRLDGEGDVAGAEEGGPAVH